MNKQNKLGEALRDSSPSASVSNLSSANRELTLSKLSLSKLTLSLANRKLSLPKRLWLSKKLWPLWLLSHWPESLRPESHWPMPMVSTAAISFALGLTAACVSFAAFLPNSGGLAGRFSDKLSDLVSHFSFVSSAKAAPQVFLSNAPSNATYTRRVNAQIDPIDSDSRIVSQDSQDSQNGVVVAAEGTNTTTFKTDLIYNPAYTRLYELIVPTSFILNSDESPAALTISVFSWTEFPVNQELNVSLTSQNTMNLRRVDPKTGAETGDTIGYAISKTGVEGAILVGNSIGTFQPSTLSGDAETDVATLQLNASEKPTKYGTYKGSLWFGCEIVDVE